MATLPTFLRAGFRDAAERVAEVRYRLKYEIDTDWSNLDVVHDWAHDVMASLNALSWAHLEYAYLEFDIVHGSAGANIAANNQIYAYGKMILADGSSSSIQIPAWDDLVFDQDSNNLLSTTFVSVLNELAANTLHPETGQTWAAQWAQSRTHKARGRKIG